MCNQSEADVNGDPSRDVAELQAIPRQKLFRYFTLVIRQSLDITIGSMMNTLPWLCQSSKGAQVLVQLGLERLAATCTNT